MKPNCLTRALDQWNDDDSFVLWYNSNHVISLEPEYVGGDLTILKGYPTLEYYQLDVFGHEYLDSSFTLDAAYSHLLQAYLNHIKNIP